MKHYKTIIIGAGISGIGVMRELALQGEKPLIIDSKKVLSQTSSKSSKMLHGGIRYLEKLHFDLVREALIEKKFWLSLRPKRCEEKEFFIPVYKNSPHGLFKLALGTKVYDGLSKWNNKPSSSYNKNQTIEKIPNIKRENLKGAISYFDVIIDDYHLGLDILNDCIDKYDCSLKEQYPLEKIEYKNKIYHINDEYTANRVIFTTGPFTDQLMKKINLPWKSKMALSTGSHLFLNRNKFPEISKPIVIQEKKRIVFLIPHPNYLLLGTTEGEINSQESLFDLETKIDDIKYLKESFKRYFPSLTIDDEDIIKTTTGIRPLVNLSGNDDHSNIERTHKIFSPKEDSYIMIGGKYTTFRKMAQDLVSQIYRKEGLTYKSENSYKKL